MPPPLPTRRQVLTVWAPVTLCMAGAFVVSMFPNPSRAQSWAVIALIAPALLLMLWRVGDVERDWRDVNEALELQAKWRAQRDRAR